jgi:hypothetical protein
MIGDSLQTAAPDEAQAPATPAKAGGTGGGDVAATTASPATEIGGREGPEPTRFGDWEKNGRCIDF